MPKGRKVSSVAGFVKIVFGDAPNSDQVTFYRGHASAREFKLLPSLLRPKKEGRHETYVDDEDQIYREIIVANPQDFTDDTSTLERLVRMQHHGLPTRLLDITSNPLMALYFACSGCPDKPGQVITFKVPKTEIKFFDSDAVSCVANLAQLSKPHKDALDVSLAREEFNQSEPAQRLLHFIKHEKPYFQDVIVPADLNKVFCVRSKLSNPRILVQSGAFFLFGIGSKIDESAGTISVLRTDIQTKAKQRILSELDRLNINDRTVFPFIENSARYIRNKFAAST